eukprot:3196369-Pleurochrysis_carterae.AAC.2
MKQPQPLKRLGWRRARRRLAGHRRSRAKLRIRGVQTARTASSSTLPLAARAHTPTTEHHPHSAHGRHRHNRCCGLVPTHSRTVQGQPMHACLSPVPQRPQ